MGIKRIPYSEFKERMSKGLCIHCNEKYTPGHNCRSKQLFFILMEEESE